MTSFFWFMANLEQCESQISGAWSIRLTFSLTPSKHSSWWRRLEDVLKTPFVFVFRRRLHQDEYVRLSLTASEDVFKTSSRRLSQDQYIRLGYTSSRRLRDVFKMSSRRLAKTSSRRLAKTSSKRLQDIFKTFWKRHVSETFFSKGDYLQRNMPR